MEIGGIDPIHRVLLAVAEIRRIPKTMGFNTKVWSHDLDDLGFFYFRKPPYMYIRYVE